MTLGKRLAGTAERRRTAIDSMVNGTISGDSKIGMPIEELERRPLPGGCSFYSAAFESFSASSSWSLVLPAGDVGDLLLLYLVADSFTAIPTSDGDSWGAGSILTDTVFHGVAYQLRYRIRESADTEVSLAFAGANIGGIGVLNIPPGSPLPGGVGGAAGGHLYSFSGFPSSTSSPFAYFADGPGPYTASGLYLLTIAHTGTLTSSPPSPWSRAFQVSIPTEEVLDVWLRPPGVVSDFTLAFSPTRDLLEFVDVTSHCASS